ncbi:MAG: Uncharacterised protein [Methanobacteriota archaeon]|nr:MAG: Uncharacterised protein [Euryarchaeota archaeon]
MGKCISLPPDSMTLLELTFIPLHSVVKSELSTSPADLLKKIPKSALAPSALGCIVNPSKFT